MIHEQMKGECKKRVLSIKTKLNSLESLDKGGTAKHRRKLGVGGELEKPSSRFYSPDWFVTQMAILVPRPHSAYRNSWLEGADDS